MSVMAFVVGGGMALALGGLVVWLRPSRPDLAVVAALLDVDPTAGQSGTRASLEERVGHSVVAAMTGMGRNYSRLEADLPIAGATLTGVIGQSVLLAIVGGVLGLFMATIFASSGVALQGPAVIAIVVLAGLACSRAPVMATKQRAANRRASFLHALGALLDFLSIQLAAGAGIKDGLTRSLALGGGWAFDLINERVTLVRNSGGQDWTALEQLGVELGIPELVEFANSIALARQQGATARETLMAKAREMRARQVIAAEANARKATERAGAPIAIQVYAVMFAVVFVLITRLNTGLRA